jgi:hypothetical protein
MKVTMRRKTPKTTAPDPTASKLLDYVKIEYPPTGIPSKRSLMKGQDIDYDNDLADLVVALFRERPRTMPELMQFLLRKDIIKKRAPAATAKMLKTLIKDRLVGIAIA